MIKDTYQSMLKAAQLQHIVRYIQEDQCIVNEHTDDFQIREDTAMQKLTKVLEEKLSEELLDEVFTAVNEYCCELADIMLAFGMKVGARLEMQLLLDNSKDIISNN